MVIAITHYATSLQTSLYYSANTILKLLLLQSDIPHINITQGVASLALGWVQAAPSGRTCPDWYTDAQD